MPAKNDAGAAIALPENLSGVVRETPRAENGTMPPSALPAPFRKPPRRAGGGGFDAPAVPSTSRTRTGVPRAKKDRYLPYRSSSYAHVKGR